MQNDVSTLYPVSIGTENQPVVDILISCGNIVVTLVQTQHCLETEAIYH